MALPTIQELWIYPVKACQGVQLTQSKVTPTGLEYDRTWCIVDLDGTHVPKLEAISGRRMPALATIKVSFSSNSNAADNDHGRQQLCLDAPGMVQLRLPLATADYEDCPTLTVESAGATAGGPWSLARLECKQHLVGSDWINQYLNSRPNHPHDDHCVNGKVSTGQFALVRSTDTSVVDLGRYPPIFPVIARAKNDPSYKARFAGNYRRLSDFAPFLLVSRSSAEFVAQQCEAETYPTLSFRGNIVIDGAEPWAEETWAELDVVSVSPSSPSQQHDAAVLPLRLHTIKPCPRCTVPCRDQTTGAFLFSENKLKLWTVLKQVFPRKFTDPEWGIWAGAFMGVYMGHNGAEGTIIRVGDTIVPRKIVPWDAHLRNDDDRKDRHATLLAIAGGLAVLGVGLMICKKSRML